MSARSIERPGARAACRRGRRHGIAQAGRCWLTCSWLAVALVAGCSSSGTRDTRPAQAADMHPSPVAATGDDAAAAVPTSPAEARPVPGAARVSHERAVAAIAAEDWTEAELELEQLVAAYPDFPGPFVNLAIVYRRDGRDEAARDMLETALALDSGHPAANNQLGMLLREAGEFAAAEAAYRRAIGADPAYALAHYNLGVLLDLYLRRGVEALQCYETFQSLRSEPDPEVGRWIVDLRRRLGNDAPPERVARENGP